MGEASTAASCCGPSEAPAGHEGGVALPARARRLSGLGVSSTPAPGFVTHDTGPSSLQAGREQDVIKPRHVGMESLHANGERGHVGGRRRAWDGALSTPSPLRAGANVRWQGIYPRISRSFSLSGSSLRRDGSGDGGKEEAKGEQNRKARVETAGGSPPPWWVI